VPFKFGAGGAAVNPSREDRRWRVKAGRPGGSAAPCAHAFPGRRSDPRTGPRAARERHPTPAPRHHRGVPRAHRRRGTAAARHRRPARRHPVVRHPAAGPGGDERPLAGRARPPRARGRSRLRQLLRELAPGHPPPHQRRRLRPGPQRPPAGAAPPHRRRTQARRAQRPAPGRPLPGHGPGPQDLARPHPGRDGAAGGGTRHGPPASSSTTGASSATGPTSRRGWRPRTSSAGAAG